MGISACSVALLLTSVGSLFDSSGNGSMSGIEPAQRLTVHIGRSDDVQNPEVAMARQTAPSPPLEEIDLAEHAELRRETVTVESPENPPDSRPAEDWHAFAEQAAKASVDEYSRSEESRASMWRQSYSTMFQPADTLMVRAEQPVLEHFGFRPEIHVAGLGVTIGSCFIGIPLVGVPVEDRTAGVSLWVCAKKS
jgi:hypothetical protein